MWDQHCTHPLTAPPECWQSDSLTPAPPLMAAAVPSQHQQRPLCAGSAYTATDLKCLEVDLQQGEVQGGPFSCWSAPLLSVHPTVPPTTCSALPSMHNPVAGLHCADSGTPCLLQSRRAKHIRVSTGPCESYKIQPWVRGGSCLGHIVTTAVV